MANHDLISGFIGTISPKKWGFLARKYLRNGLGGRHVGFFGLDLLWFGGFSQDIHYLKQIQDWEEDDEILKTCHKSGSRCALTRMIP